MIWWNKDLLDPHYLAHMVKKLSNIYLSSVRKQLFWRHITQDPSFKKRINQRLNPFVSYMVRPSKLLNLSPMTTIFELHFLDVGEISMTYTATNSNRRVGWYYIIFPFFPGGPALFTAHTKHFETVFTTSSRYDCHQNLDARRFKVWAIPKCPLRGDLCM